MLERIDNGGKGRSAPARRYGLPKSAHDYLVVLLLLATLGLGGASSPASGHAFIVVWASVPMLIYAVLRFRRGEMAVDPLLLGVAAAALGLVLLQLIPLPRLLWEALPGRRPIGEGLELANTGIRWLPLSQEPDGTLASVLTLVPGLALALIAFRCRDLAASTIAFALLAFALLSIAIGFLQTAGGAESPFYIHAITNRGLAVGLFANANHFSTMLLMSLPVLGALLRWRLPEPERLATRLTLLAAYAATALVSIFLAQTVAGLILFVPCFAVSMLIVSGSTHRWANWLSLLLPIVASLGLLTAAYAARNNAFFTSFGAEPGGRVAMAEVSARAISDNWPLGSGLGTFVRVFQMYEAPDEVTPNKYRNHAHNDYIELVLELGLPGAVLILLFLGWWAVRTTRIWRSDRPHEIWQKAASVVVGIGLAHSLVDYPLRTPALAAVFLFFTLVLGTSVARDAEDDSTRSGMPG